MIAKTSSCCKILYVLLWKEFRLRSRQKIRLLIEFGLPLLLFAIFATLRHGAGLQSRNPTCYFKPKPLPSSGLFSFLRNIVCDWNYNCHPTEQSINTPSIGSMRTIAKFNKFMDTLSSEITLLNLTRNVDESMSLLKSELTDTSMPTANVKRLLDNTLLFKSLQNMTIATDADTYKNIEAYFLSYLNITQDKVLEGWKTIKVLLNTEELLKELTSSSRVINSFEELLQAWQSDKNDVLENNGIFKLQSDSDGNIYLNLAMRNLSEWLCSKDTINIMLQQYLAINSEPFSSSPNWDVKVKIRDAGGKKKRKKRSVDDNVLSLAEIRKYYDCSIIKFNSGLWGTPLAKAYEQYSFQAVGRILYAPDNDFVRRIIAQAEQPFKYALQAMQYIDQWKFNYSKLARDVIRKIEEIQKSNVCEDLKELPQLQQVCNDMKQVDFKLAMDVLSNVDLVLNELYLFFDCYFGNAAKPFVGFDSESQLLEHWMQFQENRTFFGAVIFDQTENSTSHMSAGHVKYKIRMLGTQTDSTKYPQSVTEFWLPGPQREWTENLYFTYGFIRIQDMIEKAIVEIGGGKNTSEGIYMQMHPANCWISDLFLQLFAVCQPTFVCLSYIYSVAMMSKSLVCDKELRLTEMMRILGVPRWLDLMAWYLTNLFFLLPSVVGLSVLIKFTMLSNVDVTVVLSLFFSLAVSMVAFSFFLSTFFKRSNITAAAAGLLFLLQCTPHLFYSLAKAHVHITVQLVMSLLSNTAFSFAYDYLIRFAQYDRIIDWTNLHLSPYYMDTYSVDGAQAMLWFDSVIYLLVGAYIDCVRPGEYGVAQPFYFPLLPSFWGIKFAWCNRRNLTSRLFLRSEVPAQSLRHSTELHGSSSLRKQGHEEDPNGLQRTVQISNLRRMFDQRRGLRHLSINLFENQITTLLGHNGAGKSTTMSILSGLLEPAGGCVSLLDLDLKTDMSEIRKNIGVCPQYNILYEYLTVEEHVRFYGYLKGLDSSEILSELERVLTDLDMSDKRHDSVGRLSGGQKRKLSIALAFLGHVKVALLDEPSSGVDPHSRRSIWQLLKQYRVGRTILLTTHFMDEAEAVSDRIAILKDGMLECVGSVDFLKTMFGSGEKLTIGLRGQMHCITPQESSTLIRKITETVKEYIPKSKISEVRDSEVIFTVKLNSKDLAPLAALCAQLDDSVVAKQLGISTYGLSEMGMEEILLALCGPDAYETPQLTAAISGSRNIPSKMVVTGLRRMFLMRGASNLSPNDLENLIFAEQEQAREEVASFVDDTPDLQTIQLNTLESEAACSDSNNSSNYFHETDAGPGPTLATQLHCLLLKRFYYSRRSVRVLVTEILLPIFVLCAAMITDHLKEHSGPNPSMEIHPWYLAASNSLHTFTLNHSLWRIEDLYGTRCMDPRVYQLPNYPCERPITSLKWKSVTDNQQPRCGRDSSQYLINLTHPIATLPTFDQLHLLGDINISNWLLDTDFFYDKIRFGGFQRHVVDATANDLWRVSRQVHDALRQINKLIDLDNVRKILEQQNVTEDFLEGLIGRRMNSIVWFENRGHISSVAYLNILNNARLRENVLPIDKNDFNYTSLFGISAFNHPMDPTSKDVLLHYQWKGFIIDAVIVFIIIIAAACLSCSFVVFYIEDRVSGVKLLQRIAGVQPWIQQVAILFWDLIHCSFIILIFIAIMKVFDYAPVTDDWRYCVALFLLFFLFCVAQLPLCYLAAAHFRSPSTAYCLLLSVTILTGIASTYYYMVLFVNSQNNKDLRPVLQSAGQWLLLIPAFSLGKGLSDIVKELNIGKQTRDIYGNMASPTLQLFAWENGLARNLTALMLQGALAIILLLLIDYRHLWQPKWLQNLVRRFVRYNDYRVSENSLDDLDVAEERARINSLDKAMTDRLVVREASKWFGQRLAVDKISFGVQPGEVFGLLGVNGAGKTSLFKIITGIVSPSLGQVCREKVDHSVGYCPQEDAVLPNLTAAEHLHLVAMLRGTTTRHVAQMAANLRLTRYLKVPCRQLSGGTRRKLCAAAALLGTPRLLLLDEPSSGVDVGGRRLLWNQVQKAARAGAAVLLTSHSMEECEALCDRMAIMVNGKLRCVGSLQHLKSRFGRGYSVRLRVSEHADCMTTVKTLLEEFFPGSVLREHHGSLLHFHIPGNESRQGARLADLFSQVEALRERLGDVICSFTLCQTTLDEIFVDFAKQQHPPFIPKSHTEKLKRLVRDLRRCNAKQGQTRANNHFQLHQDSWSSHSVDT